MPGLTAVIPVGPYHEALCERAVASCHAQTVPVGVEIVRDADRHGPAWARNVGLARVTTPFVTFLDADDWLEPTFVERCLSAYDEHRYVYTDHWAGNLYVAAPDVPWVNRTWHVMTTLLPAAWVRAVGGFDESLTEGGEDTEFYMRLNAAGYGGQRLPEALFHYGDEGQRSRAFMRHPASEALLQSFAKRYEGKRMACGGCAVPFPDVPANEPQLGDVLVQAIWGGNRTERGRVTGRLYPRSGNGKTLYVDPRDADAAPNLFQRVPPAVPGPSRDDVLSMLQSAAGS